MPDTQQTRAQPRQIVGISLSPAMAQQVKEEAARREVSLRKLFEEMWALYLKEKR